MISEATCDCGILLDNQEEVEWHRTTEGHTWNKLKKEMDGNYDYAKKKVPEDARCDICNEAPKEGKRAPNGSSFQTETNLP